MKYDFCEEIRDIYISNIFNKEVIQYYLNGFVEVFNIPMKKGNVIWNGFDKTYNPYDKKVYNSDTIEKNDMDKGYFIKFQKNDYKNKSWLNMKGNYENIRFSYDINEITRENVKSNLPISLSLKYKVDDKMYLMKVVQNKNYTNVSLQSDNYDVVVNFTRTDLEIILRIIMKFLENPELVIMMYKDVLKKYDSNLISSYMDPGVTDDSIILDKSGKILEKVIK